MWSVFIQGVEVPLLQLQHFIILVVYDFFSRIVSYVPLLSVLISFRVELWWRTFKSTSEFYQTLIREATPFHEKSPFKCGLRHSTSLLTGTIARDSRDVACIAAWVWSIYPRTLGSWIFWWREINPPCLLSMLWYSHNFKWLSLLRT